jgi:hypothetical protein
MSSELAELAELAIRIEAIDYELGPLSEAVAAGAAIADQLSQIVRAIDYARSVSLTDGRRAIDDAAGIAGRVEASLAAFHRLVDALPAPDDASPRFGAAITHDDRAPFVDAWVRGLFGPADRAERLAEARAAIAARFERVHAILGPVQVRHAEVAQRRLAFEHQRARLRAGR